jgi:hypothetical protein
MEAAGAEEIKIPFFVIFSVHLSRFPFPEAVVKVNQGDGDALIRET